MIKAVELFAGIGGFRIACEQLGIETIWANDIDNNAAKVYQSHFMSGEFVQGDIQELLECVPGHDLLTAGFPCQPFSSAGKKQGLSDARGTLFEVIVKVIQTHRPKYFVLENVKRLLSMDHGHHFATILDSLSALGYLVEWRLLNAVHFGLPQNRERIVIVGTKCSNSKTFLATKKDLSTIPANRAVQLARFEKWGYITSHRARFPTWGLARDNKFAAYSLETFSEATPRTLLKEVIQENVDASFDFTDGTLERLKRSDAVNRYYNGVELIYNQGGGARMGYSIFGVNGVAPTLTSSTSRHYERYQIGGKFRRLTNVEYARIQGFPDNHCVSVSIYDQYALYGNAIPPRMIQWVLKRVTENISVDIEPLNYQMELF